MESLFGEMHLAISCARCGCQTLFYFCSDKGSSEIFCLNCDEIEIDRLYGFD